MKKIYLLSLALLTLLACNKFEEVRNVDTISPITAKFKISSGTKTGDEVPFPDKFKVKLNNYAEGFEQIAWSDKDGYVVAKDLIPGIYTVSVSAEVPSGDFLYLFNGSIANVGIFGGVKDEQGQTVVKDVFPISASASKSGSIIFKELYYAGSKTEQGGSYFRDQYYELYNNSNKVQYLDGLCIGNCLPLLAGTAPKPTWEGFEGNPDDYLFFATIWQVPGSGKDYPLAPGESAIIAQNADNHKRPELNPACPVDLTQCEFETYVRKTAFAKDNPAVNMKIAFWPRPLPQWLVTIFGGAYAIFYPQGEIDPNTYYSPVGDSWTKAKEIPLDWIVDAVECVADETKIQYKRMQPVLDAGAVTVSGTYNGKSVGRKVKETTPDGRNIYLDSNNSSEDFVVYGTPEPRRNGAKIPSWNTWAK